jgi:hypothetical protein
MMHSQSEEQQQDSNSSIMALLKVMLAGHLEN